METHRRGHDTRIAQERLRRMMSHERGNWSLRQLLFVPDWRTEELGTALGDYLNTDYDPEEDTTVRNIAQALEDLHLIWFYEFGGRQFITELALGFSVCPIHFVDYVACFDDQDPECEQIRLVLPNHDT